MWVKAQGYRTAHVGFSSSQAVHETRLIWQAGEQRGLVPLSMAEIQHPQRSAGGRNAGRPTRYVPHRRRPASTVAIRLPNPRTAPRRKPESWDLPRTEYYSPPPADLKFLTHRNAHKKRQHSTWHRPVLHNHNPPREGITPKNPHAENRPPRNAQAHV